MIRSRTNRAATLLGGLAAALALASTSCSDDGGDGVEAGSGTRYFVGDVDGTSTRLGVAVAGERVLFFLCGGADDLDDTAWASGSLDADGTLRLGPGAVSVEAALAGDAIEGTVTRPRGTARFRVLRASEPAGLWEAREPDGRVGLVVSSTTDGGEAQGVFLTVERRFQVTPVAPIQPSAGKLLVRIPALDRMVNLSLATP